MEESGGLRLFLFRVRVARRLVVLSLVLALDALDTDLYVVAVFYLCSLPEDKASDRVSVERPPLAHTPV